MAKSAPAPLHVVILAAGQGTRMKSALPKVLQPIAGKAMLGHVIDAASALGAAGIHLVIGHGAEQVQYWARAQYGKDAPLHWAYQAQQLGTAHAVLQALPQIPQQAQVLVLYGDVPLVSLSALQNLCAAGTRALALMSVTLADASGYGRILRNRAGAITGIVEDKEASAKQKLIREINTGLLSVPAAPLRRWLPKVKNDNAKGEYYLTDIVAMAVKGGMKVQSVGATPEEVEGANDRLQLARLERYYQLRQAEGLMRDGLSLADPARFDLRGTLKAGRDVKIDVGCVLEGAVELGDGVQLGACCVLRNVRIAAGSIVNTHSVLEDCEIGPDCRIGPFARIRPDSVLGAEAHVGNFVELKNAKLGPGAKANHLAYVGDAQVGGKTNIGAGVITCNYDGANKHQTVIGEDVFVGSDTQLVAPVRVGDGATIAAGSTITRDVPPGGLTIARAREQKTVPGWTRPRKQKRE